ncbi:MAG: serine hydrolase [Bacteroidota bacterium]
MIRICILLIGFLNFAAPDSWVEELEKEIEQTEQSFSGNLSVYVKNLNDNQTLNYKTDEFRYLASMIKIPVAIAILQKVEADELSLDDSLVLKKSDFVDGAGDLLYEKPGATFTLRDILLQMIKNSDSVATDMLIRLMGEDNFNDHIHKHLSSDGIRPITTILQVRYDAYNEIHPDVSTLSNMDIIRINGASTHAGRVEKIMELLDLSENDLKAKSIDEAFRRYYKSNLNSAKPETMGILLEDLYTGKLLSEKNTQFLLNAMQQITTGDDRIIAGLPDDFQFAQKTGTQIKQMSNMGIIYKAEQEDNAPVIVVAFAENYDSQDEAEDIFRQVGKLLSQTVLQE